MTLIEIRTARDERKIKKRRMKLDTTREFLELAEKYNLTPEQLNNYITLANDNSVTLSDQAGLASDCSVKVKSQIIEHLPSIRKIAKD